MNKIIIFSLLFFSFCVHANEKIGEQKLRRNLTNQEVVLKSIAQSDLIVLLAYGMECPILSKHIPTINKLSKEYAAKGINFILINAIKNSPEKEIDETVKSFKLAPPIYHDIEASLLKRLGFTTLSEVALIKLSTNEVLYKGAINNQVTFDLTRSAPTENYLSDAMKSALRKKKIKISSTKVFGCEITF